MAIESINNLISNYDGETIICPGHKEMQLLGLIEIPDLIKSNI